MKRIYNDIPFTLTDTQVLAHLKLSEDFLEDIRDMIDNTKKTAKPKGVIVEVEIERVDEKTTIVGGKKIVSKVVAANLEGREKAYAYVATCGREADKLMQETVDPVEKLWQAEINQYLLMQARLYMMRKLQEEEDLSVLSSLNPGSNPDWPITEQVNLFSMIGDVKEDIGVTLTESYLMMPIKSSSGIWFEAKDDHYTNCSICLRKNCQGRRAPFDQQRYDKIFGAGM
ncbi:MAG: hypothetical protein IJF16_09330 [Clostridia bacterium]|nr:hypothetical protein [Clostridia bacterium]